MKKYLKILGFFLAFHLFIINFIEARTFWDYEFMAKGYEKLDLNSLSVTEALDLSDYVLIGEIIKVDPDPVVTNPPKGQVTIRVTEVLKGQFITSIRVHMNTGPYRLTTTNKCQPYSPSYGKIGDSGIWIIGCNKLLDRCFLMKDGALDLSNKGEIQANINRFKERIWSSEVNGLRACLSKLSGDSEIKFVIENVSNDNTYLPVGIVRVRVINEAGEDVTFIRKHSSYEKNTDCLQIPPGKKDYLVDHWRINIGGDTLPAGKYTISFTYENDQPECVFLGNKVTAWQGKIKPPSSYDVTIEEQGNWSDAVNGLRIRADRADLRTSNIKLTLQNVSDRDIQLVDDGILKVMVTKARTGAILDTRVVDLQKERADVVKPLFNIPPGKKVDLPYYGKGSNDSIFLGRDKNDLLPGEYGVIIEYENNLFNLVANNLWQGKIKVPHLQLTMESPENL